MMRTKELQAAVLDFTQRLMKITTRRRAGNKLFKAQAKLGATIHSSACSLDASSCGRMCGGAFFPTLLSATAATVQTGSTAAAAATGSGAEVWLCAYSFEG